MNSLNLPNCRMIFFLLALYYVIFKLNDLAILGTVAVGVVLIASLTSLPIQWGWSELTGKFPCVCKTFVFAATRKSNHVSFIDEETQKMYHRCSSTVT